MRASAVACPRIPFGPPLPVEAGSAVASPHPAPKANGGARAVAQGIAAITLSSTRKPVARPVAGRASHAVLSDRSPAATYEAGNCARAEEAPSPSAPGPAPHRHTPHPGAPEAASRIETPDLPLAQAATIRATMGLGPAFDAAPALRTAPQVVRYAAARGRPLLDD